ncbi:MAG TPA: uroporphyrinogen-III C-methyltransferase [Jatrophihabitans sp.]|nr:uroporphyrinogen-III C-methyltransferase [Jatrophihabitans sp.]
MTAPVPADEAEGMLPLLLDLSGRPVLVVGAGSVGLRRARTLVAAGAAVTVLAPVVHGVEELPVSVRQRAFSAGDVSGYWLAVAATDDPAVNAAVAAEAERARVFCIRADRAGGGTARMPAVLRKGELTVSVNAGDDPRRAVALRNLLSYALDCQTLPSRPVRTGAGSVALVGGGPGDPELITVRGRRLLFEADVVVTDRLAPRALLAELAEDVEVIDCGKAPHRHNLSQDEINRVLVERARAGQRVVRLKGGDPFVFGRGGEEVQACVAAGIPVQVVPGITSALAGPSAAGIPITHRGVAADFAVVSGHRDPERADAGWNWAELAVGPATLVVLMGMERLEAITTALLEHGRPADTPAAVIQHATLPQQRTLRAPLADVAAKAAAAGFGSPAVVVIGAVADLPGLAELAGPSELE